MGRRRRRRVSEHPPGLRVLLLASSCLAGCVPTRKKIPQNSWKGFWGLRITSAILVAGGFGMLGTGGVEGKRVNHTLNVTRFFRRVGFSTSPAAVAAVELIVE